MNTLAQESMEMEPLAAYPGLSVRIAEPADRDFVMSLTPRLVASGPPPWRDPRKMLAAYVEVIGSILRPQGVQRHTPRSGAALLIAEDAHATPIGFVLLVAAIDCYTHERHGHVAQIVIMDPQDIAAGQTLIAAAQDWTRSRGCRLLTMSEFWANHPASAVYQQPGFAEELVKYRRAVR